MKGAATGCAYCYLSTEEKEYSENGSTEELLVYNNHLYEWAKTLDFTELSLPYFYDNFVKQHVR